MNALRYIEQAKAADPRLESLEIEMVEETEQSDYADKFDYYYVPTIYIDGKKAHEGGMYADEMLPLLRQALEEEECKALEESV